MDFTVLPGDTVISLDEQLSVTFECNTSEGTPYWTFMITFYASVGFFTTEPKHATDQLDDLGITYFSTEGFTNISIPRVVENNGTQLYCAVAVGISPEFHPVEDPIDLTIVGESKVIKDKKHCFNYRSYSSGPPLPPDPVLKFLLPSQLEIQWETPYSHENFPVESYKILMISKNLQRMEDVLVDVTNYTNTSYVFTFDSKVSVLDCHSLTVNVTAIASIGESIPRTVEGNYPIGKKLVSWFTCTS